MDKVIFNKRTLTSVIYVLAVIGLCAAKLLIPDGYGALLFDAVFCFISVAISFEVLRAFGCVSVLQRAVTITFCALCVPMYVLSEMLMGSNVAGIAEALGLGAAAICVLFVCDHAKSDIKSTLVSLFTLLYAGLLPALLSVINHLEANSMLAIMFTFICVPFTDAFAYIIGVTLGRVLPLKLAPQISPNKTVVGAVGGLIGGIVGAVVAYYLSIVLVGQPSFSTSIPGVVAMILIGIAASVATQFGDLFESQIKRACKIKDMGRLLPGHGGVTDRFDGNLFAAVVILISFIFIA